MSNQSNFPHDNANDVDQSSDETEQNPTTVGSLYIVVVLVISTQRPTALSQSVVDQRTISPREWTNPQLDELIQRRSDSLEATVPVAYFVIITFSSFLIYYYWPLLVIAFLAYRFFVYNNQPTMPLRELQSQYSASLFQHAFDPYRDAQEEGRTANPTDETIQFSSTVENPAPYGVQAALATHLTPPENLDNIERGNIITNNDQNNTNLINQNQAAVQKTTNTPDLVNHNAQTSQISPIIQTRSDPPRRTGGINLVNTQPERADSVPEHNEAVEIEGNIHAPADGAHPAFIPGVRFRSNSIPKLTNSTYPNDETRDRKSL